MRYGKTRQVKLINEKFTCICKDDIYSGIPCRHEVAIFLKCRNSCEFKNLPFHNKWILPLGLEELPLNPVNLENIQVLIVFIRF